MRQLTPAPFPFARSVLPFPYLHMAWAWPVPAPPHSLAYSAMSTRQVPQIAAESTPGESEPAGQSLNSEHSRGSANPP